MNTIFRKHAHCTVQWIGLIQTLHTWVARPLLRYCDGCRRKSNLFFFLFLPFLKAVTKI